MFPVYKGTYERGDDLKSDYPNTTSSWRDHVIAWSKDLGRSIDYLETRPDIDRNKLGYEGVSWGGAMGSVLPAVEDRIKVCVLIVPGFNLQKALPEVDATEFRPTSEGPGLDAEWPLRFLLPSGDLPTPDVPAPRHSERTQAPGCLRNGSQYSTERNDQGNTRLAGPLSGTGTLIDRAFRVGSQLPHPRPRLSTGLHHDMRSSK